MEGFDNHHRFFIDVIIIFYHLLVKMITVKNMSSLPIISTDNFILILVTVK